MEDFLRMTKLATTQLHKDDAVHVVLCNEACDLDSAVCALVYAYYLHKTCTVECLYLPVLNIHRRDYHLKTEVTYLFGKQSITPDLLTFIDDVDLMTIEPHKLQLTLVDHHVLSQQLSPLARQVVQVIDHRPVEKQWDSRKKPDFVYICEQFLHTRTKSCVASTVELVGSCCTLVTEEITKKENFSLDPCTAVLLLGSILTDTINLSEAAGKTTSQDMAAVKLLRLCVPDIDTQSLFDDIHQAKTDLSGLSSQELLEKDLKMVSGPSISIAMSSVMMTAKELLEREDLMSTLSEFSSLHAVAAVVIMTLSTSTDDRVPQRQLAIFSSNRIYRTQIADVLQTCANPSLQLEVAGERADDIIIFNQGNIKASRKKVMPILKAFLNGEKTPDENSTACIERFVSDSQDGSSSIIDLSDSGKGESQGESDRQIRNEGVEVLSPLDPLDLFDPISPLQSETSASSEGQLASPVNHVQQLEAVFLGNQNTGKVTSTDLVLNNNEDSRELNFDLLSLQTSENCMRHSDKENSDPYSLIAPADSSNNIGNNLASSDFIDNLIDTKTDDFEMTEADVLHPSSIQDFLTPGPDSPMEMSSGQNSGQASKVSSYPVTPPNSFMDTDISGFCREHNLPSFNSLEMVERIKAKKASLTGVTDECDVNVGLVELNDSTFTPQNSYAESNMDQYFKETELPSFHNSEMVQRIKQKRASLENDFAKTEDIQDESEERFPWTPHNSYVENSLDKFGQQNLPSFNNAEMVRKIQEKRESLPSVDENENVSGASGCGEGEQPSSVPYTPQNSCIDGEEGLLGGYTDMRQVVDRLAGASGDTSAECSDFQDRLLELLHKENTTAASNNVVSHLIAQEILASSTQNVRGNVLDSNNKDITGNIVAADIYQQMELKCRGHVSDVKSVSKPAGECRGSRGADSVSKGNWESCVGRGDVIPHGLSEDQISEAVMNEVAFALASELIQTALETFSPDVESSTEGTVQLSVMSRSVQQDDGGSDDTSTSPIVGKAAGYIKTLNKSDSNSISVETEYLPEMDPLHGNMDIVESTSLETDAVREVVESSSFRKASGQESPAVCDEMKERTHQKTNANRQVEEEEEVYSPADPGRKHIKIDPDLSMPLEENSLVFNPINENSWNTESSDEPQKKKVIYVKEGDEFRFSISSDSGADNLEELSDTSHHFSGSTDERKEVFMTTAGRISIGVDQDIERSGSLSQGSDIQVFHTETKPQVGDVAQHVFDVIPAHSCEDVFYPVPNPQTLSAEHVSNCPQTGQQEACNYASFSPVSDLISTSPAREHPPVDHTPADHNILTSSHITSLSSSSEKEHRMKGVEVKDEWQDEDFPKMLAEEAISVRPQTLGATSDAHAKKKIVPDLNLLSDGDASEGDFLGDVDDLETPKDLDIPQDLDDSDLGELEWENDTPVLSPDDANPEAIPEYTEKEEKEDARHWKTVTVGDKQFRIDLRVIEPYKKVLSHGGYYGDGLNAIILFCGCYLPDRRRKDYNYVMDNLFYYVVNTLEQLVAEDYMIVYFHGATPRKQMPSLSWLKKCYQMIDRRLRKNLKALLLVHPTLWLKTIVMMTRPFISTKFTSKLHFVRTLQDLSHLLPMEHVYVPDQVQSYDANLHNRSTLSTPSSPPSDPASP